VKVILLIEKIEVGMTSGDVHNFKRGEFGVENIEIDELRGIIQISYANKEGGRKYVLLPLQNVEKCEYLDKELVSVNASGTGDKMQSGTTILDKI
jgi:phage-related protein